MELLKKAVRNDDLAIILQFDIRPISVLGLALTIAGAIVTVIPSVFPLPPEIASANAVFSNPNQPVSSNGLGWLVSGITRNASGFQNVVSFVYSHTTAKNLPPPSSVTAMVMERLQGVNIIPNGAGGEIDTGTLDVTTSPIPKTVNFSSLQLIPVGKGSDWSSWVASEQQFNQADWMVGGTILVIIGAITAFVAPSIEKAITRNEARSEITR